MKVFVVNRECSFGNEYLIVARDISTAEKIFKERNKNSEIYSITLYSKNILIEGFPKHNKNAPKYKYS